VCSTPFVPRELIHAGMPNHLDRLNGKTP